MERLKQILATAVLVAAMATVGFLVSSSFPLELEAQAGQVFNAQRVTVGTTATLIYTGTPRGAKIRLCNRHTTPIFIGPVGVTTANGFEIINATCEDIEPAPKSAIYGIVAAATARVDYFEHQYAPRGQ